MINQKLKCRLIQISKKYGINKVIFINRNDDTYVKQFHENCSYIIGKDTILIGVYENIEYLVASFFHEIGHIYKTKDNFFNTEQDAWNKGFIISSKYGFSFSKDTYMWCENQLKSYDNIVLDIETKSKLYNSLKL